jgi:peptidoglycan/xylan/chitin deacetylase (PgdA/CDA1 family)
VDVLVLAYHALSPAWPAALSIPPQRFEEQLRILAERGYESVTFGEAVAGRRGGKLVAITFDDGFRSVIDRALPILTRFGFVATAFVPTAYIGRPEPNDWPNVNRWIGGSYEPELEPMGWPDLAALADAGWEIGSHTCTHPDLTSLDDQELGEELVTSRRHCERELGVACHSIAYPYGAVDARVTAAAARAGYTAGAALPRRIHRAHRLRWPRVGIWHRDSERIFLTKLSPLQRRRLDLPSGRLRPLPRWRFAGR